MTNDSSQHVLLVDDEPHILRAAEFKLKRSGYRISCASDGEQAWQQIRQQPPDMVVTDLQMPRVDGLELIRRIRSHEGTQHLPVILLTAKGYELAKEEGYDRPQVFAVMAKPFSPRDLCQQVERALEQAVVDPAD